MLLLVGPVACAGSGRPEADPPPAPEVTLRATKSPPVLDGVLDEVCWTEDALRLTGFTYNRAPVEPADPQTVVRVVYDRDNIYFAFECLEPLIDELVANTPNRDGQVWVDDCVDFFIDPEADGKAYYQLAVNPRGVLMDIRWGTEDKDFNAVGYRAGSSRADDRWIVELAFRWDDFILSPAVGSTWRMNFCRNRLPGKGGLSTWSWTPHSFHNHERRGYVRGIDVDFARFAAPQLRLRMVPLLARAQTLEGAAPADPSVGQFLEHVRTLENDIAMLEGAAHDQAFGDRWADCIARLTQLGERLPALRKELLDRKARTVAAAIHENAQYGVAVTHSSTTVGDHLPFDASFETPARVALARNDTEAVQLVLLPFATNLLNIAVTCSAVRSDTAALPDDAVRINPVGLLRQQLDSPNAYGDVLLPPKPFDAPRGRNQPVLVSVWTETDTPAGLYRGVVTVQPENSYAYEVLLEVEVWDFAISDRPTLDGWFGETGDCTDWLRSRRMSSAIVGRSVPFPADPDEFPAAKEAIRERIAELTEDGALSLELHYEAPCEQDESLRWHGDAGTEPYEYTSEEQQKLQRWFRACGKTLEELGVADRFFIWIWDEPSAVHHQAMKQKCAIVRQGSEQIGRLQPGGGLPKAMVGQINMWCPLSAGHSGDFERAAHARGERYWWYTCVEPQAPFANIAFLGSNVLEARLLPWMMFQNNVDGYLFWTFSRLTFLNDVPFRVQLPDTDCGALAGSGDGMLWYRGMPSFRLHNLADGYEDHQYLSLLRRQVAQLEDRMASANDEQRAVSQELTDASRNLLEIPRDVIDSLTSYAVVPGPVLEHRRRVAQQIVANREHISEAVSRGLSPLYSMARPKLIEAAEPHLAKFRKKDRGYALGVMPPLSRVFRDGGPPLSWTGPIEISMARGELEHRELALFSLDSPLSNFRVEVNGFKLPDGSTPLKVTAGPVGFVRTARRPEPNPHVSVGDVMLPPQFFNIRAGELQGIYLLVETSADTPAGLYKGQITTDPKGAPPKSFEVHIRVWDFVLPKRPPLHGWCSTLAPDIILKHKLEPGWFDPPFDLSDPITEKEWKQLEDRVVKWFDDGHSYLMIRTPGAPSHGSNIGAHGNNPKPKYIPAQVEAMTAYWRGFAEILERRGLLDKAAIYVWDEPHPDRFGEMAELCDLVHKAHPGLRTCAAGDGKLRPERKFGRINVYCPISSDFEPSLDLPDFPRGSETWWYVCWNPPAPAPNVMVDNPPLQQRIIGWQSWHFGVTGFLYWETHKAMWEKRTGQRRPFTDFGDTNNGGDGTLIYRVDGKFVPSLRLRHLGDGMEDLQYIGLLESMTKKLDRKHGQARQAAGAALRRAESLLSERKKEYRKQRIRGHTPDPNKLLSTREDLAQAILQIQPLIKKPGRQEGETHEQNTPLPAAAKDLLKTVLLQPAYRASFFASRPEREAVLQATVKGLRETDGKVNLIGQVKRMEETRERIGTRRDYRQKVAVTGDGVFELRFDLSGEPPGKYQIAVGLGNNKAGALARATHELRILPPSEVEVTFDENRVCYRNGKPFFPIGLYHVCRDAIEQIEKENREMGLPNRTIPEHLKEIKDHGFNCVVTSWGFPDEEFRRMLVKAGLLYSPEIGRMGSGRLQRLVEDHRKDPNILWWYGIDEPYDGLVDKAIRDHAMFAEVDPYRPVAGAVNKPDRFGSFLQAFDILMPDAYGILIVAEWADGCIRAGDGRVPVWQIPQAFATKPSEVPTPQQLRCEAFLALTHGATGLIWFTYAHPGFFENVEDHRDSWYLPETPLWDEFARLNREISDLAPVLLSPPVEARVTASDEAIHVLLKKHKGKHYLFAVNATPEPVTCRFTGMRPNGKIKVLPEGRTIRGGHDGWTDDFEKYGTRVYRF